VLIRNHYHLLVETPGANLARRNAPNWARGNGILSFWIEGKCSGTPPILGALGARGCKRNRFSVTERGLQRDNPCKNHSKVARPCARESRCPSDGSPADSTFGRLRRSATKCDDIQASSPDPYDLDPYDPMTRVCCIASASPCLTSGPTFVTLRPWKRTLSASDSGPNARRAKSDFLLVSVI
jgi:hypothetical protein